MPTNNSANYRPVQYNTLVGAANGGITSISPGTAGQVLTSNGSSSNPSYQSIVTQSQGAVLLQTLTASNSASLTFTSSVITTQYPCYQIQFNQIVPQTNGRFFQMDMSTNNGSTYLNSNYQSGVTYNAFNSATIANNQSTTTAILSNAVGSSGGLSGDIYLYGLQSGASTGPTYTGTISFLASISFVGGNNTGSPVVNNLKFSFDSGNITSGTISLYGIPQTPIIPLAGNLSINTQVFTYTGSTQTYTPTTGMQYCIVECLGGGGGGGGSAAQGATQAGAAGGGGGGGYCKKTFSSATIGASQQVVIGAGGSGASAGNNSGSSGGNTTFGVAPLLQANGGGGGGGVGASGGGVGAYGGVGGSSGGDVNGGSTNGVTGFAAYIASLSVAIISGSGGGNSIYGSGGGSNFSNGPGQSNGNNAAGYGAGGSGAICQNGSASGGGNGSNGIVIITEYIVS